MKLKIFVHIYCFHLFIVYVYFIFIWPKIKSFDPSDITVLEFNDCQLDISHEFEIMESEIQNESDSKKEHEFISKIFEQYEEKSKPNLEETEIINIGTKIEVKKSKSVFIWIISRERRWLNS